jgi:hypothetical protein
MLVCYQHPLNLLLHAVVDLTVSSDDKFPCHWSERFSGPQFENLRERLMNCICVYTGAISDRNVAGPLKY